MEKNAAAGRTPSSLPMSTPPPSSLSLSSPKFAPLSPLQTNSLHDSKSLNVKAEPTNFNLPPSYGEDLPSRGLTSDHAEFRQHLGEQRNERFPSGGKLTCLLVHLFFLCSGLLKNG